jgi:hypothetical protein
MTTPKEDCFKDALEAYKDAFPKKDPNVELFKDWYRDADGTWNKAGFFRSFSHWIGSILKTGRIASGAEDPRPAGEPNPTQWRTPDISASDGKVYDLKFTNAEGKVDPWGDTPGMGGGTQKEDQAAINKQADPKNGKAMSLDKDTCKCKEREQDGEPQPVEGPAPASLMIPGVNPISPLTQPGGAAAPEAVPEMIPEFIPAIP